MEIKTQIFKLNSTLRLASDTDTLKKKTTGSPCMEMMKPSLLCSNCLEVPSSKSNVGRLSKNQWLKG